MVEITYTRKFEKQIQKLMKTSQMEKIQKIVLKISLNPEIGKPMQYERKGTRDVYIKPFRISYAYFNDIILFLTIYHKDEQ